jgi:hypothetical protein
MDDDDFFLGERPRPERVGFEMKDGRHVVEWREFSLFAIGRVWKIDIVRDMIALVDYTLIGCRSRLATGC